MIDSTAKPPKTMSIPVIGQAPSPVVYAILITQMLVGCLALSPDSNARADGADRSNPPATQTTAASETRTPTTAESPAEQEGDDAGNDRSDSDPANEESRGEAEESTEGDANRKAPAERGKDPRRVVLDTVYDDRRVGEDQTKLIEAELGLVEDAALNDYVRSVAVRLLRHATSRPFDYEFKIVDQSVPNAFALPGGKIYVSRGLLALATSEDELANVLGHEITHAAERHASARIDYNRRMNPLSIGLLRAARIAAYGRDQELDADRGGQLLAARAGYDPAGIASFLRKLDASERYEVGWARLPFFLSTHPTSPERAAIALDRAASLDWQAQPGVAANRPDGYYSVIDGLVIGDDPAGGLFDEENRFVHPELEFSLRFPRGWETMNTNQAVRAISPARDAQATLSVVGGGDRSMTEIVDAFLEEDFEGMRVRVRDRREIRIGELPAIRVEGRASGGGIALDAQMTFVKHGGLVYRLTMLSLPGAQSRYRGRARAFAHSFRPLDAAGARSLAVTRLRIARARENETLQSLSTRTRNELEVVFTGVLNGIYAQTRLAKRTPIKIGIAEPYIPRQGPDETATDAPRDTDPVRSGR